ncbi:hypothetical protein DMN77_18735 [Paenibacillus sp. 79R4]|uniref:hypothetical protein n=1 Tax=Paenibacillus sp. 79R4 TaxID=2212847 RepID=UPI0015C042FE|nr:hypothetical protein [Paenibacillus sp. 79R4]NWL89588.1 hypothetical protein [Paenibacillus sp. 79R4]
MKNTLGDLNNHLFAQLERLSDEELAGEKLADEINRAKAVTSVASQIIANGTLVLEARRLADDRMNADTKIPKMLEGGS